MSFKKMLCFFGFHDMQREFITLEHGFYYQEKCKYCGKENGCGIDMVLDREKKLANNVTYNKL